MKIDEVIKTPTIFDVDAFLKKAPADELFTVQELSQKFSISESSIKGSLLLKARCYPYSGRNYYGSPKAIERFQNEILEKRLGENEK